MRRRAESLMSSIIAEFDICLRFWNLQEQVQIVKYSP